MEKTSDAGSQYCSGRVGRGWPPTPNHTPILTPHTQTYKENIQNACFLAFQLDHYGQTDGPIDQQNDRLTE